MSRSLYITRKLEKDSPFFKLEQFQIKVQHGSLLDFPLIIPAVIPDADWYFFYSKTGVKRTSQIPTLFQKISTSRVAAFGKSTANSIESELGIKVQHAGAGTLESNIDWITKITKQATLCFIQGKQSRKSLQQLLPENTYLELEIYDSCYKEFYIENQPELLVFTSPLNADAYFDKHQISANTKVFSIGKTTYEHLLANYQVESKYPSTPSESALYALIHAQLQ